MVSKEGGVNWGGWRGRIICLTHQPGYISLDLIPEPKGGSGVDNESVLGDRNPGPKEEYYDEGFIPVWYILK